MVERFTQSQEKTDNHGATDILDRKPKYLTGKETTKPPKTCVNSYIIPSNSILHLLRLILKPESV